ncbi:alpha-hydroxy-acid oxidizing enzyme [Sesbania bispinosa]|nr:alpha-hydroxy-acid oxidizing enzyme [Sesbania bispinosa]
MILGKVEERQPGVGMECIGGTEATGRGLTIVGDGGDTITVARWRSQLCTTTMGLERVAITYGWKTKVVMVVRPGWFGLMVGFTAECIEV